MALSSRKERDVVNGDAELEAHPLYVDIQRAKSKIESGSISGLLQVLHVLAEKVNIDKEHTVHKHTAMHQLITDLFAKAKGAFSHPDIKNEIRLKQAMFLEHMKEFSVALSIFDSLAKKASSPLRWNAMNSRTWLLKRMSRFDEALASANELIKAFHEMPEDQKPGSRRLHDANKLKRGIEGLMAAKKSDGVVAGHSRFFGRAVVAEEEKSQHKHEDGRISPLVQQLFQ